MPLLPTTTMTELEAAVPSARRVLFAHYHLGGCNACAYGADETLEELCARNELDLAEVIGKLEQAAATDAALSISPSELSAALAGADPPTLVDIRTREEHEAVKLPGSLFFTQALAEEMRGWDRQRFFVLYDHTGPRALDAAAFQAGHGFARARALSGGIDGWSREVDPTVPRYRLERA